MNKDDPDSEKSLFERAMSGVNRNHRNYQAEKTTRPRTESPPPSFGKSAKKKSLTPSPAQPVAIDETDRGEDVLFVRAGLQKKVIRRLRRGETPFSEILDLHGMTALQAETLLEEFVDEASNDGISCVLIIHGKGYHSENRKGVLKPMTINWLKDSPLVQAFSSAQPKDGGTGAVYVLLRNLPA